KLDGRLSQILFGRGRLIGEIHSVLAEQFDALQRRSRSRVGTEIILRPGIGGFVVCGPPSLVGVSIPKIHKTIRKSFSANIIGIDMRLYKPSDSHQHEYGCPSAFISD